MSTSPHQPTRTQAVIPWWMYGVLIILSGLLIWSLWPRGGFVEGVKVEPRIVAPRGDLAEDEKSTIKLYEEASPSVVHVTTLTAQRDIIRGNQELDREVTLGKERE